MSRFFSEKFATLEAYTPGEQPKDQQYIKLNTNENAFPPHPAVAEAAEREARRLHLYPDPGCTEIRNALAGRLGLVPEELVMVNGSDDILNFAFMAFCDARVPAVFPDITYGFYPVFARLNQVSFREIPLQEDLTVRVEDYLHAGGTIFLANPNAPTGIALSRKEIERILQANPDHVVVVDEAYVDFGAESCIPLIREYDNLLVTQTFSKARSLAGGRLGFGAACQALIRDLETIRYSTNPYNIDRMTLAAGTACLQYDGYNTENCRKIAAVRETTRKALQELGFEVTDSRANFLFARHPAVSGEALYRKLKERGILIRHFSTERIKDYNRISIGTEEQMETLIRETERILRSEASRPVPPPEQGTER